MFYLKCLTSDEELFDLIKREIDVRTRFVVCDSDNARASKWVRKEIEYITDTEPKRSFLRLDLSKPIEEINKAVDSYVIQTNLFISYLHRDRLAVEIAKRRLRKYDLQIFPDTGDHSLPSNLNYGLLLQERIKLVLSSGFFVLLVTESPLSIWLKKELDFALKTAEGKFSKVFIVATSGLTEYYCLYDLGFQRELVTRIDGFGEQDWPDRFADEILRRVYPLGSLKTFADNFRKANDVRETKKCDRLFIEEAKRSPHPGVMEYLANCYKHGWHGLPVDPYQERSWLSTAIHEGGRTDLMSRARELNDRICRMEQDKRENPFTKFLHKIWPAKTKKGNSNGQKKG